MPDVLKKRHSLQRDCPQCGFQSLILILQWEARSLDFIMSVECSNRNCSLEDVRGHDFSELTEIDKEEVEYKGPPGVRIFLE